MSEKEIRREELKNSVREDPEAKKAIGRAFWLGFFVPGIVTALFLPIWAALVVGIFAAMWSGTRQATFEMRQKAEG